MKDRLLHEFDDDRAIKYFWEALVSLADKARGEDSIANQAWKNLPRQLQECVGKWVV